MSQRDVERLLGRLILDPWWRDRFFEYPIKVLREGDYDLSERELRALLRIEEGALSAIGAQTEPLSRLAVDDDEFSLLPSWGEGEDGASLGPRPSFDGPGDIETLGAVRGEECGDDT